MRKNKKIQEQKKSSQEESLNEEEILKKCTPDNIKTIEKLQSMVMLLISSSF
jgi:hypothetical protein